MPTATHALATRHKASHCLIAVFLHRFLPPTPLRSVHSEFAPSAASCTARIASAEAALVAALFM